MLLVIKLSYTFLILLLIHQIILLIKAKIRIKNYKKQLKQQQLFRIKMMIVIHDELTYILSNITDANAREIIEVYLQFNKSLKDSTSQDLTELQLKKL